MPQVRAQTTAGADTTLSATEIQLLGQRLRGQLITPDSPLYDQARTVWNGMIERSPALISRCAGTADVMTCVQFAREYDLPIAVRGGGHHIAGNSVCDGGITIDLGTMKWTRVDPAGRTARVGAGATLGDFDHETQAFALATPVGINSTTGIAGLTLGGGFGWLTRMHGMTIDNLLAADVVTADARLLHASEQEHPDLFWALRGGGGNFGVVTSFEFRLHPVGPQVLCGLMVFSADEARQVLARYRAFAATAPDELSVWVVLREAPPLPFLPESVHGQNVVILAIFYGGEPAGASAHLETMRGFGTVVGEAIGVQPYTRWQAAFDPLLTPGARNYWKSHNFAGISDGAADLLADYAARVPGGECEVFIGQIGGASMRVAPDATAYPHRDTRFVVNVHTRWRQRSDDSACIDWARQFFADLTPHALEAGYTNFMTQDENQRVHAAFGLNYPRLVQIKRTYDPQNVFCLNHNIRPD